MTSEMERTWRAFEKSGAVQDRNVLVQSYIGLVKSTAEQVHTYVPSTVDLEDLESAGMMGLIDAIHKFERERGVKFETFCRHRIWGAMLDELRGQDRFTRSFRTRIHRLEQAAEELERTMRRAPTEQEIATHVDLPLEEVVRALDRKEVSVFSLDTSRSRSDGGDDNNPMEMVPDERGVDPVSAAQTNELAEQVVALLNETERRVVMLYYYDQLTMKEIGKVLNLTESRVCQIHSKLMKRVRRKLGAELRR